MLNLPKHLRIFWAAQPCDMRKQFDGLAGLVRQGMGRDPTNGDLYVFHNRRRDLLKVLFFDAHGFCLLAKRIDKGSFRIDIAPSNDCVAISGIQLASILSNLVLSGDKSDF